MRAQTHRDRCRSKEAGQRLRDTLQREYPHHKILYYDGASDEKTRATIGNCDEEWVKYDVVIYTPVIVYGVDFTARHFHAVYGIFTGCSVDYLAAFQMLERARNVIDCRVVLELPRLLPAAARPPPPTLDSTRELLMHYADAWRDLASQRGVRDEASLRLRFDTYVYNHWVAEASRHDLRAWLLPRIRASGGTVTLVDDADDADGSGVKDARAALAQAADRLSEAQAVAIVAAADLSSEQHEELLQKPVPQRTPNERSALQKRRIRSVYSMLSKRSDSAGAGAGAGAGGAQPDALDVEFVRTYCTERMMERYLTLAAYGNQQCPRSAAACGKATTSTTSRSRTTRRRAPRSS